MSESERARLVFFVPAGPIQQKPITSARRRGLDFNFRVVDFSLLKLITWRFLLPFSSLWDFFFFLFHCFQGGKWSRSRPYRRPYIMVNLGSSQVKSILVPFRAKYPKSWFLVIFVLRGLKLLVLFRKRRLAAKPLLKSHTCQALLFIFSFPSGGVQFAFVFVFSSRLRNISNSEATRVQLKRG